jgi:hypothetical protein
MVTYNGHPSYNAWNVSLWINNDEGLYNEARRHVRREASKGAAAAAMLFSLREAGFWETPDGVRYTKTNIRRAMAGM